MHIDENKKYDKRNIERNIKDGVLSQKEYEIYLSRLPDVRDKAFPGEESGKDLIDASSKEDDGRAEKAASKKNKGKGK